MDRAKRLNKLTALRNELILLKEKANMEKEHKELKANLRYLKNKNIADAWIDLKDDVKRAVFLLANPEFVKSQPSLVRSWWGIGNQEKEVKIKMVEEQYVDLSEDQEAKEAPANDIMDDEFMPKELTI